MMNLLCALLLAAASPGAQANSPPNIVLISVDGLRYDRTHLGGNPRQTTPTLDALAADGVSFSHAWSQGNESLFSHASIFTGMYPSELGKPDYVRYVLPESAQTIPETLKLLGYRTGSFQAGGHIGNEFGFNQGYDRHKQTEDFGSFFHSVPMANTWLDELQAEPEQAPFFMFLHGYDCHRPFSKGSVFHHPFPTDYRGPMERLVRARNHTESIFEGVFYKPMVYGRLWHENGHRMLDPGGYLKLAKRARAGELEKRFDLTEADQDHLMLHYDAGVLAADTYVGFFIEHLGKLGLWENTLIIVLSDHGEDLQDHGFTNHRAVLQDSTTRVPMIITGGAVPEEWRGTVRSDPTDAVDIFPTIAEIVGTVPPATAKGRSLWSLLKGKPTAGPKLVFQQGVLGHLAVRSATHRLVFLGPEPLDPNFAQVLAKSPLQSKLFSLYDTRTDPKELKDIKLEQPEALAELGAQLRAWYAGMNHSDILTELTDAQLKMLQERGYW